MPSHITLGCKFGLKKPSMVLLEQIRTVNKEDLQEYIGTVDEDRLLRQINANPEKDFWIVVLQAGEKRKYPLPMPEMLK